MAIADLGLKFVCFIPQGLHNRKHYRRQRDAGEQLVFQLQTCAASSTSFPSLRSLTTGNSSKNGDFETVEDYRFKVSWWVVGISPKKHLLSILESKGKVRRQACVPERLG